MKRIILILASILAALGLVLVAFPVLADGEGDLNIVFSSTPRFPVVGEEAVLTFKILFADGDPVVGQEVMVMMMKSEAAEHGHEDADEEAQAQEGKHREEMAGMVHEEEAAEPAPMIHLMPEEVSPGVYSAKHTFEVGGRYVATVNVLEEEFDVVVPVRSAPVAWWFVGALAGISALLAGTVAVVKTVRRSW